MDIATARQRFPQFLRRPQASQYLAEVWGLGYKAETLRKLCYRGEGPETHHAGRVALHTPAALDVLCPVAHPAAGTEGAAMTPTKTKIVVIRHGSTDMNSDGNGSADCVRGWKDLPLSAKGIQEAKDLAQELRHVKMDVLYPSDLDRAEHTARIISKATGVSVGGARRGLRPWNAGSLTGKSSKQ